MMKEEDIHILYADTPTSQKMCFKWQPLYLSFSISVHPCASEADVVMSDDDYSYITASN